MSKDPAFLFYSSDFLSGTMLLSDEQVGKYVRLLCLQHQKGHLIEKDMMKICITHDEDIFAKFVKDDGGLYYNIRLDDEIRKRTAYSESRRKNREKKEDMINISDSYVEHMENENINENIDINKGSRGAGRKGFVPPTHDEVKAYCEERKNRIDPQHFIDHYQARGWILSNGKKCQDWQACVRTWEQRDKQKNPKPEVKYVFGGK